MLCPIWYVLIEERSERKSNIYLEKKKRRKKGEERDEINGS